MLPYDVAARLSRVAGWHDPLSPARRAQAAWEGWGKRLRNDPDYAHVWLLTTKQAFLVWAEKAFARWAVTCPGVRPALMRKDPHGHFELSNLKVAAYKDMCRNTRRARNTRVPPGTKCCGHCRQVLPLQEFALQPRGTFGRYHLCKVCSRINQKRWRAQRRQRAA